MIFFMLAVEISVYSQTSLLLYVVLSMTITSIYKTIKCLLTETMNDNPPALFSVLELADTFHITIGGVICIHT